MPSPDIFRDVVNKRIQAKKSGDKVTANALKLVVNSTFGVMLDRYNKLCDPLMARSVCITGQLFLCELAGNLTQNVPTIKLIQLNTDGIMISFEEEYYPQVLAITDEWQQRTGFELEEDKIKFYICKDINNYIIVFEDGHTKCKGGYLVRGISPAGAFNINNNFTIVSQAVKEYFVNGTIPEATILNCDDIFQFQIIAKAGGNYNKVVHFENGKYIQVQKCNRVYATSNIALGTLYKEHKATGKLAKIGNVPDHCIVDNANELSINDIDKSWYIDLAYKYIKDYIGDDDMAAQTVKKSIYSKLMMARIEFGKADKQMSGVNAHAQFKYYELSDIVPVATKILNDLGLCFVVNIESDKAVGTLIDNESGEKLDFICPFVTIAEPAKFRMNEIQALGGAITYYRRYLYMQMLDIVDPDAFDCNDNSKLAPPPSNKKAPTQAKTEERAEIKEKVLADKPMATQENIDSLKKILNIYGKNPDKQDEIQQLVIKTDKFTKLTDDACLALIQKYGKQIERMRKEDK